MQWIEEQRLKLTLDKRGIYWLCQLPCKLHWKNEFYSRAPVPSAPFRSETIRHSSLQGINKSLKNTKQIHSIR